MHESYQKWLDDGCPKIYCECPCHAEIIVKKRPHKYTGIPKYINGHQCIGKPCSEETKEKIRKTKFSENNPNFGKTGEKSATFGRKHDEKELKIMREKATGKKQSQETIKKRIKKVSGINHPMFNKKGKDNPNFGRKQSEKSIQKMIENRPDYFGDKNPNWRGGASFGKYCPKFNNVKKEEIRNQYNRKCYFCGKDEKDNIYKNGKQIRLSIHHINEDKKQGCDGKPWKLIPLCIHCHNTKKIKILNI